MVAIKNQKQKGFTLVEILVAVAIFSLVAGIASAIFVSAIQAQRKSLASQQLLDQTSYVMEYMSRALRMAKKDDLEGVNCIPSLNKANFEFFSGGGEKGIRFRNYNDDCQEFYVKGNKLREKKNGKENYLTSPDLKVIDFNIGPDESWDQHDDEQPRVTIFLRVQGMGEKPEQRPQIQIQTTISQRNPDIKKD